MRPVVSAAMAAMAMTTAGTVQAQAAYVTPAQRAPYRIAPPPSVAFGLYKSQMLDLRGEAIALREADGGTLSPEHNADIQRRIDRITQLYHRRLQGLPN